MQLIAGQTDALKLREVLPQFLLFSTALECSTLIGSRNDKCSQLLT